MSNTQSQRYEMPDGRVQQNELTIYRNPVYPTESVHIALLKARQRFFERNKTSEQFFQESLKYIPGGDVRPILLRSPYSVFLKRGNGSRVMTEDGHEYIDFVGVHSAGLYGHNHPVIRDALLTTITTTGLNVGGYTIHEQRHAELLCDRFHLQTIRFTNSGTEANLYAIQGAKRFTRKRKVVIFSGACHFGTRSFNTCIGNEFIVAEYNNLADAKAKIEGTSDLAAVLMEGMQVVSGAICGLPAFLQQVQASAKYVGAVFILDEIQTSRLAPGGYAELENLKPDITTLGKYLGGGMAFGAFGGRADIMAMYDPRLPDPLVHNNGTFNTNTLAMVAGFVGLRDVYTPAMAVELNKTGDTIKEVLSSDSRGSKMMVTGRGSLLCIHFLKDGREKHIKNRTILNRGERLDDWELKELFWLEMMERGFWVQRAGGVSLMLALESFEYGSFLDEVKNFVRRYQKALWFET